MNKFHFTPSDIDRIQELYASHTNREIATIIGCSVHAVNNRAHTLGLKKPAKFRLAVCQELGRKLATSGTDHRFPKGHIPANKGKKMPEEIYERCQKGMFKKGNLPKNTLYDGAERIRTDRNGKPYIWVRLSAGKWKYKHILQWEKVYGKIPPDKILYCKDGNTLNCKPENWEPVTKAESMARCRQSDETLAMQIAGRDKEMKQLILDNHPELIELKRISNQLKQNINECT